MITKEQRRCLIELINDLTPLEAKRLVYYCLDVPVKDVASTEGITTAAIYSTFASIKRRISHQEQIAVIQALFSKGFFINDP